MTCSCGLLVSFCYRLSCLQERSTWIEASIWSLMIFQIGHQVGFGQPIPCAPHCCVHASVLHRLHWYKTRCECASAPHLQSLPHHHFTSPFLHVVADDEPELKRCSDTSPSCQSQYVFWNLCWKHQPHFQQGQTNQTWVVSILVVVHEVIAYSAYCFNS